MSFAEFETSTDQGEPIRLYEFRFGPNSGDVVGYTDAERDVTFDGLVYAAIAIDCGEITSSGSLDKSTLMIQLYEGAGLTDIFRLYPSSSVVTAIIREGHANDPDSEFKVGWTGRIVAFQIDAESNVTELTGEPVAASMRRSGLRRHWQFGCPHALYGPRCKANKVAATQNAVVLTVNGPFITLSTTWVAEGRKPKYVGGIAQWTLPDGRIGLRTIIRSNADGTILLSAPPAGLDAGETVAMTLGCNHKSGVGPQPDGDCAPLHNNVLNFGGQMFIPYKNPIGIRNNYY